jgi:pre-mRNA-splicing factor RBM22/SLT11
MNQHKEEEFPIICDQCLGDNSFVRMVKRTMGSECRFCQRVFTSFQWKRNKTSGLMRTEICGVCATIKNLCQSCVLDLQFHLPSYVRDSILPSEQSTSNASRSDYTNVFMAEQAEKMLKEGGTNAYLLSGEIAPRPDQLLNVARSAPTQLQAMANYEDKAELSKRLSSEAGRQLHIKAPRDQSVTSLYIGGVNPALGITEEHIRRILSQFGPIESINLVPNHNCAFVTFEHRSDAETCMEHMHNRLTIRGTLLKLLWARPKKKKSSATTKPVHAESQEKVTITHAEDNLIKEEKEKLEMINFLKQPEKYLPPLPGSAESSNIVPEAIYPSMMPSI